jgi:hypothetical protein
MPTSVQSNDRQRLADTLVQAVEATVCAFGLIGGFAAAGKPGAIWALVSAVIVLRPGYVGDRLCRWLLPSIWHQRRGGETTSPGGAE